ncbi:hypothetical protein CcCBS67573_g06320 [Chytriomyces confervae]|uniref:Uncharacterized protein n=1 Tax=Chytriomyces confervae TaxID=246404 RepID=A0A507F4H4_9FUNG|nr:hypothetical protein CcCBS67573_g06320 [Chytriomyces confervae]
MLNENKVLFVQYQSYQPVKIQTHQMIIATGESFQMLSDVADVIGAYRSGSLLADTPIELLTLHAVVDGVEGHALEIDLPISTLSTGLTAKTALVIKSMRDMDIDSSSPTAGSGKSSRSSINKEVIQLDSIDLNTEHLGRRELLAKLSGLVGGHRFVRLTSPQASGKSSLLNLYRNSLKRNRKTDVVWISCLDDRSCSDLLLDKAGIDLSKESITDGVGQKDLVVFLDDAQAKYRELTFWNLLIKMGPNWIPSNIRFVISSTHLLAGGIESPLELRSLPVLERNDFLLSSDEANQFLDFTVIGLPQSMRFPTLKQLVINECGGLIGALRLSVDSLKGRFSKDMEPPEQALLQYFLSKDYVTNMDRCFGSAHSRPIGEDFKKFLKRIFVKEEGQPQNLAVVEDEKSYASLKKSGILVELPDATFTFSSPLAKRYYFKWVFPNRSLTMPTSLHELVHNVVESMSSNRSTVAGDFPKEAVFQHLFLDGLARFTKADCSICPELSKIFRDPNSGGSDSVRGEIDFYLNGNLRWGIELLVNGIGIGEHLSRFSTSGKYFPLGVADYVVVDLRRNKSGGQPPNIARHPKRITVFFKDDKFESAQCLFGSAETIVQINLAA